MSRLERARGLPELHGEKVHGRHSVSAQGAHAGCEFVQSPGDPHGPGSSPSHDERVWSADSSGKSQPGDTTPSTVLVWIDGAWSGDSVSCKLPFAGAGRLKNHVIETPRVSRWETLDYRWKHDRNIDENSPTCRVVVNEAARYVKETAEQLTPVTAEVPDATDSLNNEFERVKESEEQFLEESATCSSS